MGVGCGLYMYDVVVKRSRSLPHLLMSSCRDIVQKKDRQTDRQTNAAKNRTPATIVGVGNKMKQ